MQAVRYSLGLWVFGNTRDRYVGAGYRQRALTIEEKLDRIAGIEGIRGIEVTYPLDINEDDCEVLLTLLKARGLGLAAMGVELVCDAEWQTGSFTSELPAVRQKAISRTKGAMDLAAKLGVEVVSLWLGQDGFDYPFQADYAAAWDRLVDGIGECARYRPEVKLGIEYKKSEPRMSCFTSSAGMTLALCQDIGLPNVGVTLDIGHALNAGESPAQAVALLHRHRRLFHLHLNDNYRNQDDDMPVGTVHWPEYLELLQWLERSGYRGWYSLDLYPYRDDPAEACSASLEFLEGMRAAADRLRIPGTVTADGALVPSRILAELARAVFPRPKVGDAD